MKRSLLGKLLLGASTLVGLSTLAVGAVGATALPVGRATLTQPGGVNQTSPAAGTYSGTVKQNGPTLVTHDNQGDRTLVVQAGATVLRDGKAVAISDLKKDDKLTATLGPDGVVQRIDASSPSDNTGFLKWLIPVLIAAVILLALLAWWLSRRRRGDFIMEADAGHTGDAGYSRDQSRRVS